MNTQDGRVVEKVAKRSSTVVVWPKEGESNDDCLKREGKWPRQSHLTYVFFRTGPAAALDYLIRRNAKLVAWEAQ